MLETFTETTWGKRERQLQKETRVCGINRWMENGGLVVVEEENLDEFGGMVDGERNEYMRERERKKERNGGEEEEQEYRRRKEESGRRRVGGSSKTELCNA